MKQYVAFKFVRPILALICIGCSFAFTFCILMKEIPKDNISTMHLVCGIVLGWAGTVVSYYFGTSKDKSDTEQSQRAAIQKISVLELLAKIKDGNLTMEERQDWLKKLKEQYPEYANVQFNDLP